MVTTFEDFCLCVYVVVDDLWKFVAPLVRRPGPAPRCSDSELVAMVLVAECRGWDVETEALCHWRQHRDLFPNQLSQSRFNRRRRDLSRALDTMRQLVLGRLDLALDRQCVVDSLPVPVVPFHLVPGSGGDWDVHEAAFGYVASKKQTIYGYKLHLLVTLGGVVLDYTLAPANVPDLAVGLEMLAGHSDLTALGDKASVDARRCADLFAEHGVLLISKPRRNQKKQWPPLLVRTVDRLRQIVETVNGQLAGQFRVEHNRAHTFSGLCARLRAKLTAHTLCVYLNRLLGNPDPLQIKRLAFPD